MVFSLLLLLQIIRAVRREHIRVEYSMAWFGAAVLLLALSISEPALRWLSLDPRHRRSIPSIGSHCGSAIPVLRSSVLQSKMSDLKDNNILLAQKIGMLDWEVKRQASEIENLQSAAGQPRRKAPGESRERRL